MVNINTHTQNGKQRKLAENEKKAKTHCAHCCSDVQFDRFGSMCFPFHYAFHKLLPFNNKHAAKYLMECQSNWS